MERKLKRYYTCVDPALDILKLLLTDHHHRHQYPGHERLSMWKMHLDLSFFKLFFWGLSFPEEFLEADWVLRFTFMVQRFRQAAIELEMQFEAASPAEKATNWELMSDCLRKTIQEQKPQAREMCFLLLDRRRGAAFQSKHFSQLLHTTSVWSSSLEYGHEILSFITMIRSSLDVLGSSVNPIDQVKQQIESQFASIDKKLRLFGSFVNILNDWPHRYGDELLMYHIQTWASQISCLACLYWIHLLDGSLASSMEIVVSDLMQRSGVPYGPGTMALFIDVYKPREYHKLPGGTIIFPLLLNHYIDFLLETYVKDDVELLREGLTFLFSFVMDSPNKDSEETELILAEIYAIVCEVPPASVDGSIPDPNTQLSSFLPKIDRIQAKVRELYVVAPLSLQPHSPMADAIVFLDSLLQTLKKMLEGEVDFIPSVKNRVVEVHERLALLRPFLQSNLDFEDSMPKHLCTQIVSVIHFASYVTKLCQSTSFSVWYGILCLPNVIQDINFVNDEVKKIEGDGLHNNLSKSIQVESSNVLLPQAKTSSTHEGAFIGFEDDVGSIIDNLLRGTKDLTIISISGMPGQGKTRLAKRISDDPRVKLHFHKVLWSYVSKECKKRQILGDILWGDSNLMDDHIETQDVVEKVWRSLKGIKYILVLDDIWDVDAWLQVKDSFPDDKVGSRVLFTSRYHDLASQCKPNSVSHRLRLFSDKESLELMKDTLSYCDGFPPKLEGVGRQIAVYCKGLPLAVVLIATHLRRITPELDLWMKVAENLESHLESEGCMHIIELSYKYLPHHLKPCFLYFGSALQRGAKVAVGYLTRLWINEGFIKGNETQCSEDLAMEYLEYLVSQNLVSVTTRGSMGKIKICAVHDLIYDLCFQKAMEDNCVQLADYETVLGGSHPGNYNSHHHRVSIRDNIDPASTHLTSSCSRKELPTSQIHSLLCSSRSVPFVQYSSLCSFICSFRVLTVLEMTRVHLTGSKFPEVIMYNVHLRYLALRGAFSRVPSSIANLWNLETLIIFLSGSVICSLPKSLWEMQSLRYVRVVISRPNLDDFGNNGVSSAVAATSNIETIHGLVLRYNLNTHFWLRSLSRLRKLFCLYDKEFCVEWLSMFGSLEKLESLTIGPVNDQLIPKPSWRNLNLNFPENLKKLYLGCLELPWRAMSMIGKLPNLQVLKLRSNACKGTSWEVGDGEFPQLKYLKLQHMNVKQITTDSEGYDNPPFPCLEKISLYFCKRLEEIPSSFGEIYTLNTIHVISSPKVLDSVKEIVQQQQDIGNQDLDYHVLDQDVDDPFYI